jgi:hypothetical protein
MAVETHLMALDGSVTTVSGPGAGACAAPAKSAALEPAATTETHSE